MTRPRDEVKCHFFMNDQFLTRWISRSVYDVGRQTSLGANSYTGMAVARWQLLSQRKLFGIRFCFNIAEELFHLLMRLLLVKIESK